MGKVVVTVRDEGAARVAELNADLGDTSTRASAYVNSDYLGVLDTSLYF